MSSLNTSRERAFRSNAPPFRLPLRSKNDSVNEIKASVLVTGPPGGIHWICLINSTRQGNGLSSWTVREKRGGPIITVKRKRKKTYSSIRRTSTSSSIHIENKRDKSVLNKQKTEEKKQKLIRKQDDHQSTKKRTKTTPRRPWCLR